MLGIIRVLTTENQEILQEHGNKMEEQFGIQTITRCIENQPNGIFNDESEKLAIPKIVKLAEEMNEQYSLNAITISCAADPGLKETRKHLRLPILGAGASGAEAAVSSGNKVAVIGITENPPEAIIEKLGGHYFSYSFSPGLRKTTDLFEAAAKELLLYEAEKAIEKGADVILFACTGFSTIRLKTYLVDHIEVPIIDLVEAQATAYQPIERKWSL
ncbi:aspartate/glutamate racemase family protein [Planococcus sp. SE5232]|uniref:aspartate/glutamate racemase family protein n=1 Tax=unclassified Planococcus (in: firmicutes) TaxID=2662419 RepID=UPI003D6B5DCE